MADTWTINYLPEDGGRLTGKLTVGDDAVRFDALYDSSNAQIVKGILSSAAVFAGTGGHASYVRNTDTELSVVLPRTDIASAERAKKGMMKRAVITMRDGSRFVFDYGMLSTKKLVAAING